MKLDHDCVRDIMLTLEALPEDECIDTNDFAEFEKLRNYENSVLLYASRKLIESGFVNHFDESSFDGHRYYINELSWEGHAFLDNIRDNNVWSNVKSTIKSLTSISLSVCAEIASSYIKNKLGLD